MIPYTYEQYIVNLLAKYAKGSKLVIYEVFPYYTMLLIYIWIGSTCMAQSIAHHTRVIGCAIVPRVSYLIRRHGESIYLPTLLLFFYMKN